MIRDGHAAYKQIGMKVPDRRERLIDGVSGVGFEAASLEDEAQRICNKTIAVYNQDAM
jgi:hypothetical protein